MNIKNVLNIKGYVLVFAYLLLYSGLSVAADIKNLRQLEAAENIEKVSQQITKAYFYLHQKIRIEQAEQDMREGLAALEKDIKILSDDAQDSDQQGMVLFMTFTLDELKDTINKPYSKEHGALMLDYSETLLEGAESLAQKHTHKKDAKEAMLITVERMSFLLERITKFYIAFRDGFNDFNNVVQLKQAVAEFEADLKKVKAYKYPENLTGDVKKITKYWPIAKTFYLGIEKSDLPLIVFISTEHLEGSLEALEHYHDKLIRSGG